MIPIATPDLTLPMRELIIDMNDDSGVFALSLVTNPATQAKWVALQEESAIKFSKDGLRYVLTGALMIPDQAIFRSQDGNENVYVKEQTIRMCQEKFFEFAFQSNTTHQHLIPLEGNTVIESWIVEDSTKDKSAFYGFSYPKGTWMISVKINDKQYWTDFIETGKVTGFSLEGLFKKIPVPEQVKEEIVAQNMDTNKSNAYVYNPSKKKIYTKSTPNKSKKPNKMASIFKKVISALTGLKLEEAVLQEFAEFTLADGTVINVDDNTLESPVVDDAGNVIGTMKVTLYTPEQIAALPAGGQMTPPAIPASQSGEAVANPAQTALAEDEKAELLKTIELLTKNQVQMSEEIKRLKTSTVKPLVQEKEMEQVITVLEKETPKFDINKALNFRTKLSK